ncbi:YheC/YheD family protein [Laceyella putida]|uniref:YheC/YheD family protein n=1 Tax=Laceyella putida TaxID=110101 RepID=A0ABW2RPE9_9BACL
MNSILCKVKISSKGLTKAIGLSQSLMKRWGCTDGQSIKVEIGNRTIIIQARRIPYQGEKILISTEAANYLALPYSGVYRARFLNRSLKLGPVIGIFTTSYSGNTEQPFGKRSTLFKEFIKAGLEENPIIYAFTPDMVDWQNHIIYGWHVVGNQWKRFKAPFPDVIYERIPNRTIEARSSVQACLNRFKNEFNCQIFNQGFFNKWKIHQWLSSHPYTASFVPETYLSPSISTIKQMLDRHYMVYLKPSGGSLGLGIFRITHSPGTGYFCRYREGNRNVLHKFRSLDKLINHYFAKEPERFNKYIVQQGIRLIKHDKRPVDFRVHLHKDGSGQWTVVAIGSKAAGPGCVTTHVRTGGIIIPTDQILQNIFEEQAALIEANVKQASITIAETLEDHVDGPLGELGMDMGVDRKGSVWLFEVNSKPGRHIFHHPSLEQAGRQSAKLVTEYSLKLSNFI